MDGSWRIEDCDAALTVSLVCRRGRRWKCQSADLVSLMPMGALVEMLGDVALGERLSMRFSDGHRMVHLRATVREASTRFVGADQVCPLRVRVEFDCLTRWVLNELMSMASTPPLVRTPSLQPLPHE